jgi:hypothetical protein
MTVLTSMLCVLLGAVVEVKLKDAAIESNKLLAAKLAAYVLDPPDSPCSACTSWSCSRAPLCSLWQLAPTTRWASSCSGWCV